MSGTNCVSLTISDAALKSLEHLYLRKTFTIHIFTLRNYDEIRQKLQKHN